MRIHVPGPLRLTLGVVLLGVAVGLSAGTALAAKGGKNGTLSPPSTITLDQAGPHLGGYVTFSVSYAGNVKSPRIQVMCYQDGALVYGEAGPADQSFLLGGASSTWLTNGGPASCTADLFYIVWNGNNPQQVFFLVSTSFDAAG